MVHTAIAEDPVRFREGFGYSSMSHDPNYTRSITFVGGFSSDEFIECQIEQVI